MFLKPQNNFSHGEGYIIIRGRLLILLALFQDGFLALLLLIRNNGFNLNPAPDKVHAYIAFQFLMASATTLGEYISLTSMSVPDGVFPAFYIRIRIGNDCVGSVYLLLAEITIKTMPRRSCTKQSDISNCLHIEQSGIPSLPISPCTAPLLLAHHCCCCHVS